MNKWLRRTHRQTNYSYRISTKRFEHNFLLTFRIAVIGVTVVFGTTQEGAVDDLSQLLQIRNFFDLISEYLVTKNHYRLVDL